VRVLLVDEVEELLDIRRAVVWRNGMPAERVAVETPQTPQSIRDIPTAELLRLARESTPA
jgi:hypothetical protein